MRIYDSGMMASAGALRRFCLLQPGFLGCAKLKQAAWGDVTHVASYASRRNLSPGGTLLRMRAVAYCKILRRYEQPPVQTKFPCKGFRAKVTDASRDLGCDP